MSDSNSYTTKSQAKKFFLKNFMQSFWKVTYQLGYLFVKLLRLIGGLFMEAIGRR